MDVYQQLYEYCYHDGHPGNAVALKCHENTVNLENEFVFNINTAEQHWSCFLAKMKFCYNW